MRGWKVEVGVVVVADVVAVGGVVGCLWWCVGF